MDKDYKTSKVTGKTYNRFGGVIKILNTQQAAFYLSKGVPLLDLEPSMNKDQTKEVLVFYFQREDTRDAYNEWCERKKDDDISG